jgi:hypothetical protein
MSVSCARALSVVMAITICRIWVPPVNRFTAPPRALRQCGPTSDGWSALAWMETIMSKTTDGHVMTAKGEVLERELSLEELEAVAGGEIYIEFGGYKVTSSDVVDAAKWVWNKLF